MAMQWRTPDIINYYKQGYTLRQTAKKFGCSLQNVHQLLKRWSPDVIRAPYGSRKGRADMRRDMQAAE